MHRVLVVDDEIAYRAHLKRGLTEGGFAVAVAASEREALELAPRFRPDVVVADWLLGDDANGLQLARAMQDDNPGLRIIIITGFPTDSLRERARQASVFAFLEKPFRMGALLDAVERATNHPP